MGHNIGNNIYPRLAKKIDGLTLRAPANPAFLELLKTLYTTEEAEIVCSMPYTLSTLSRISKITRIPEKRLKPILEGLCGKGLVIDIYGNGEKHYMPSPIAIGIFEFTMMRTGNDLDSKHWAELFHAYMQGSGEFYESNCAHGEKVSLMRTLPHEASIHPDQYVEVLDYEKATWIVETSDMMAIGLCSCRHEKTHVNEKQCNTPLSTCSTFGYAADYLVRHNMAQPVSKEEMKENIERSRELGLVLNADNVRRNVTYICHCCGCCCNVLLGINNFGFHNVLVTSSFIASIDLSKCIGCGKCAKKCPIQAISMEPRDPGDPVPPDNKKKPKKKAVIETEFCIGCGVCATACDTGALSLVKRKQKVIHPETTFQRIVLQTLDRGTLQNQIFDDPGRITHKVMRGLLGAFFRLPPVKKALMSDMLRSKFLSAMEKGLKLQGKGWMLEL